MATPIARFISNSGNMTTEGKIEDGDIINNHIERIDDVNKKPKIVPNM